MTNHQRHAEQFRESHSIRCAVLTISDTRTPATDTSGSTIVAHLRDADLSCAFRALVPDEPDQIEAQLRDWISDPTIDAILTTGGTGLAARDTTINVADRLITHHIPGFGELFRMLSWEQVGSSAMLSRAVGGMVASSEGDSRVTFLFCMPGSTKAVDLAMRALIIPELPHLLWDRSRSSPRDAC